MSKAEEQADRLVAFLQRVKKLDERGIMADLRCGWSPAKEHRAWPHIAKYCQLDKDWSRIPVQTVCAAFATHPETTPKGNMGSTISHMVEKDGLVSFDGRFKRLLTCETAIELCERLPAIIRAAKSKKAFINYRQLYCDICWWEISDIKIRWAEAYWGTTGGGE